VTIAKILVTPRTAPVAILVQKDVIRISLTSEEGVGPIPLLEVPVALLRVIVNWEMIVVTTIRPSQIPRVKVAKSQQAAFRRGVTRIRMIAAIQTVWIACKPTSALGKMKMVRTATSRLVAATATVTAAAQLTKPLRKRTHKRTAVTPRIVASSSPIALFTIVRQTPSAIDCSCLKTNMFGSLRIVCRIWIRRSAWTSVPPRTQGHSIVST
jgi:hypothetical protein